MLVLAWTSACLGSDGRGRPRSHTLHPAACSSCSYYINTRHRRALVRTAREGTRQAGERSKSRQAGWIHLVEGKGSSQNGVRSRGGIFKSQWAAQGRCRSTRRSNRSTLGRAASTGGCSHQRSHSTAPGMCQGGQQAGVENRAHELVCHDATPRVPRCQRNTALSTHREERHAVILGNLIERQARVVAACWARRGMESRLLVLAGIEPVRTQRVQRLASSRRSDCSQGRSLQSYSSSSHRHWFAALGQRGSCTQ